MIQSFTQVTVKGAKTLTMPVLDCLHKHTVGSPKRRLVGLRITCAAILMWPLKATCRSLTWFLSPSSQVWCQQEIKTTFSQLIIRFWSKGLQLQQRAHSQETLVWIGLYHPKLGIVVQSRLVIMERPLGIDLWQQTRTATYWATTHLTKTSRSYISGRKGSFQMLFKSLRCIETVPMAKFLELTFSVTLRRS